MCIDKDVKRNTRDPAAEGCRYTGCNPNGNHGDVERTSKSLKFPRVDPQELKEMIRSLPENTVLEVYLS